MAIKNKDITDWIAGYTYSTAEQASRDVIENIMSKTEGHQVTFGPRSGFTDGYELTLAADAGWGGTKINKTYVVNEGTAE